MGDPFLQIDKIPISSEQSNWIEAQDSLKRNIVLEDDFVWTMPANGSGTEESFKGEKLRFIGGVDLSFSKDDPSIACGSLVVVNLDSLNVVYDDFTVVQLHIPYIPGFLAFRELLMVDGNGLLHPRGFGLACHLGIMANLPTIGIGKNLHHVDGLTQSGVKQLIEAKENCAKDHITLTGNSGHVWGAVREIDILAMRSTEGSSKPIFISTGHRISLDTCIKVVKMCCKYRVPEPIRQADIRSRSYLQKHAGAIKKVHMQ
ncbi:endonuclease V family protein isoform X3 [Tasmannia lanceolata]|uniref:endonuclease V family protein isoform X3 n=1 Tax=Tasmannia lanceolata TaxID=3420 RepID=UPI00406438FB